MISRLIIKVNFSNKFTSDVKITSFLNKLNRLGHLNKNERSLKTMQRTRKISPFCKNELAARWMIE